VISHLVLSTLVLALAIAAARVLPLTARTRHALLLAGLAKFAIPSAAIAALLRAIGLAPVPAAIAMPLRIFGGGTAPAAAAPRIDWIPYAWGAVAALIAARWLILRARTVAAALRTSSAPSARELEALAHARRALGIAAPVDLVRSPICEAPAVVRILRPVIVLPSSACDALDDDELRALLLHECAHVSRRDNLVSALEALAAALLWFHPLVWLALRDLATTREEACDEVVSDAARSTDSYLSALTKICRAVLASRAAGASCMASARLNERIEHLMSYERLKEKALSHRAVLATAIVAFLAITTAATALSFERKENLQQIYKLDFTVTSNGKMILIEANVTEKASGRVVFSPKLNTQPNIWGTITHKDGPRDIELRMRAQRDGSAELLILVMENGERVQTNLYTFTPKDAPPAAASSKFTGDPISLDLKDADLKDVLNTFAQITGLDVAMTKDVEGKRVTISLKNVPWDEALDRIARENGLTVTVEGKLIRVGK